MTEKELSNQRFFFTKTSLTVESVAVIVGSVNASAGHQRPCLCCCLIGK